MATKWSANALNTNSASNGGENGAIDFGALLKDEYGVVFLQGKNSFGDIIYCYLKVLLQDYDRLKAVLGNPENIFNANDFGTIVAAGRGDPTDEVKAEIAATYRMFEKPKSMLPPPASTQEPPLEKKAWDEY